MGGRPQRERWRLRVGMDPRARSPPSPPPPWQITRSTAIKWRDKEVSIIIIPPSHRRAIHRPHRHQRASDDDHRQPVLCCIFLSFAEMFILFPFSRSRQVFIVCIGGDSRSALLLRLPPIGSFMLDLVFTKGTIGYRRCRSHAVLNEKMAGEKESAEES